MNDREQDFISATDRDDLDASLQSSTIPLEDDMDLELDQDNFEQEEDFDDIPEEYTESYGTGVHDLPGYREGGRTMRQRDRQFHAADPVLTGGDIDANYEQAYAVGDEAVGGSVSTPDQDVVDEMGEAVGLEMPDREFLHTHEILERRDQNPWELDPKSSEDYEERRRDM